MSLRSFILSTSLLAFLTVFSCIVVPTVNADEWNQVFDQPEYFEVVRGVHLRAAPSNNASIIITLKPGTLLKGTAIENGWHKVTTADGKSGYIFKRFLRSNPDAAARFAVGDVKPPETPSTSVAPEQKPAPDQAPEGEPLVSPEPQSSAEAAPAEEPLVTPAPTTQEEPLATPPAPGAKSEPIASVEPQVTQGADCKRIKFQPGAVSGSVDRSLEQGGTHCYQLGVSKNQWMEVWLTSATDNAVFQIFSPSGSSITSGESHWLGRTDQNGDFIILVSALDGKDASYNLKIQIK